ncbi:aminotransferase class V-fold PLP-dependent enzyme [Lentzea tibetensis]|uniref:Aminotransferase class V-fold PLP-dependent enzyme n=1 Tax=Lentzea tibetensis TaxID=2591470 RepID=A0A563ERL6_9PSEU|nr:aminotransferase class V-fold PLP-dependent enzyme [Lentzea tibetensis]TWP50300.1 aminotransferase class V-fold PLP-dependent enzyme [Lentzea tibetensis]
MSERIFLDSAGSSLPPEPVLDEVIGHLRREAQIGGYRAAQERAEDLEKGYDVVAELLGCRPDEVAFTDSATRSWLTAFDAVPLKAGDRILVTEVEYAGNAVPLLRRADETGAVIEVVPSDHSGQVDLEALGQLLDERVKLVSIVHVPTNSGLINPAKQIADKAHEVGALVLLDACQSAGQLDLRDTGADMLSFTGRKWLRGPRGTGALMVRNEVRERLHPRLVDMHSAAWVAPNEIELRDDARVFELWESSVADRLGLIAAVRYALDRGLGRIEAEIAERATRLRDGLSAIDGVEVRDIGVRKSGLVTFTVDGLGASEVKRRLYDAGVTVSTSDFNSTLFDMTKRGIDEVVRASPHYFVTEDQIDEAVDEVSRSVR